MRGADLYRDFRDLRPSGNDLPQADQLGGMSLKESRWNRGSAGSGESGILGGPLDWLCDVGGMGYSYSSISGR